MAKLGRVYRRGGRAKVTSISVTIDKVFTAAGTRNHTTFYAEVSLPKVPTAVSAGQG